MKSITATAAVLYVLCGLVAAGCDRHGDRPAAAAEREAPAPAAVVRVAPVEVRELARHRSFVGSLHGEEEATLSSLIEGQIERLHVDLGDSVEAGQVLAEIHDDRLQAQLREAEARLEKARADAARGESLAGGKVISAQELEAMRTAVAVAEAQRDTLRVLVENAAVRSPLTGSVARRHVAAGEYVRPGSPLYDLVADRRLRLRGDIPERFAGELRVGQTVRVEVDAVSDRVFTGRLSRISPSAKESNRSVTVEADIDNADGHLKPGFFARARVITREGEPTHLVPEDALIVFAGVRKVFVAEDDVARERRVRTGRHTEDGMIEIESGLSSGESVVVAGATKLEDGTRVDIAESADSPSMQDGGTPIGEVRPQRSRRSRQ